MFLFMYAQIKMLLNGLIWCRQTNIKILLTGHGKFDIKIEYNDKCIGENKKNGYIHKLLRNKMPVFLIVV